MKLPALLGLVLVASPVAIAAVLAAPGMVGLQATSAPAGGAMAAMPGMDSSTAPSAGAPPTREDALRGLERLGPIVITSLAGFSPAHGVRGGHGTAEDPFLLADFFAPSLAIRNVSAAFIIRHVYVDGALQLAWTGPGAVVERSTIGFLDVNPNTRHTAPATWFDVHGNRIGNARLRHAGGTFEGNDVGATEPLSAEQLALEVQGYDGLRVDNDTVRGPVEIRLHGHHFSDSFADAWLPMDTMDGRAEDRYHALRVEDNTFQDPSGHGVVISDRAHAANDRTAASEPDPALNGTHRHFTDILFAGNRVLGAGIVVEQPNARDPHHEAGGSTTITLRGNVVQDPLGGTGILVKDARNATLVLDGNVVGFAQPGVAGSAGVLLQGVTGGSVQVAGGRMVNLADGVRAEHVAAGSPWSVQGVQFDHVEHEVYWDGTDRTPPGGAA